MKKFVGITGTTSVGKSEVAVLLAKKFNSEVISADSMQIYKGMDIGTAKLPLSERQGVKHYMLDIIEPDKFYSSFLYQEDVRKIINGMNTVPVIAGGTGFYFDSLLYPPEFGVCSDEQKKELRDIYNISGLKRIQEMLFEADPETYNKIDVCNPKRVLRALEIAYSGSKRSEKSNLEARVAVPKYECRLFVLQRDRESLYEQIDKRVDNMIKLGLVKEAENLISQYGKEANALQTAIGYKELIDYFDGRISLNEAIDKIKINTRHYAKRQITYFKKMNVFEFIDVDGLSPQKISDMIAEKCKDFA